MPTVNSDIIERSRKNHSSLLRGLASAMANLESIDQNHSLMWDE